MSNDPWLTDDNNFPSHGSNADKLRFLLNYAVLAPSSHNTQPWLFRVAADCVEILADRTRCLPVVDPHDRALVISCGAALEHLVVALRRFGYLSDIEPIPDPADHDCLARLRLGGRAEPDKRDRALFEAIRERRTNRHVFADRSLPEALINDCQAAAERAGARLTAITDAARRRRIAELVAEGDRLQFAGPRFRRELAAWVHSRRAASRDGMSGSGFGMPDSLSPLGALVIRTFDLGGGVAAKDQQIAAGSPALAVLSTPDDTPKDWLVAGQALSRVLLTATAAGVSAAYLNQPIEVESLRPQLVDYSLDSTMGTPQLLFRLGYGPAIEPAVRRPVDDVILAS